MDTILTVKNEHLKQFTPEGAVSFFHELLCMEASSLGIEKTKINVPSMITVRDGGIDAEIRDVQINGGQGIIEQGLTCYQIKTGEFNLKGESKVKSILFKRRSKELKPKVKSCLDNNGTLVVVLFGYDDPDPPDGRIDEKFRDQLISVDPKYSHAKIKIWRQNDIIRFLQPYPSLALKANGRHQAKFETHQDWASHADMESDFLAGEEQEKLISTIRAELHRDDKPVHIHIWGEPGIGKTRLVLEVTDTDDLRPFVIYCAADNFHNSELMSIILRDTFHAILVLDECDSQSRKDIWNRLKCHSPRIKLVSIYDEPVHDAGLKSFKVPPLEEKQISTIIQGDTIFEIRADHWAKACEGSPKVAHVVGQHVMMDSADILQSLDDIWERYIAGSDDKNSQTVEQRRRVLRYLSRFKRFGYGRPVVNEAMTIWKMIYQADQTITWAIFQEIIDSLRNRKILQGTHTLHITPKLLHIKLWIDWWNIYGEPFPFDELFLLPDSLRDWSFEMFEYASGSEVASRCVKALLGKQEPFQQNPQNLRTASGARLFWVLTKAEPEAALRCLQNTLGTWSKEALSPVSPGRTSIIWALEEIAIRKDLFTDAARLLLDLAEFEDESWSNHASSTFVKLFYISWHQELSPTEASPQERFPILKEALESPSKRHRLLALMACERALRHHFFGPATDVYRVFGREPQLWRPATWGELFDAYRQVWLYLFHKLESLPEDERQKACDILLRNAYQLARLKNLTEMIIDTIDKL